MTEVPSLAVDVGNLAQVIERYTYTPYGQITVDQVTSWGNRA